MCSWRQLFCGLAADSSGGGGGGGGPFMRGCDSLKLQSDFVENVLLRAYSPVGLLRVCDF